MSATADATLRIRGEYSGATAAIDRVHSGVNKLQPSIARTATAASGLSSALGGVGSSAGAVVGAAGNMAEAFATGGFFLVAVSAATTGLGIMADEWRKTAQAAEKSKEAQVDAVNDLANRIEQATGGLKDRIAKAGGFHQFADDIIGLHNQIGETERELREFSATSSTDYAAALSLVTGKEYSTAEAIRLRNDQLKILDDRLFDQQTAMAEAQAELAEYNRLSGIAEGLEGRREKLLKDQADRLKALLKEQRDYDALSKARRELENMEADAVQPGRDIHAVIDDDQREADRLAALERQKKHTDEIIDYRKRREKEADQDAKRAAAEAAQAEEDKVDHIIRELQREERYRLAIGEATSKRNVDSLMLELSTFDSNETAKTFILERELEKRQAQMQMWSDMTNRMAQESIGFISSVANQAFSQTLDVIQQVSAGQQVEFDRMAASFIRNVGTQLVGIGIRFAAEGAGYVASALIPGNQGNLPGGVALLATGSTIAGVGAQMAIGGAVAEGQISRFRGNAGGGGGGSTSAGGAGTRAQPREYYVGHSGVVQGTVGDNRAQLVIANSVIYGEPTDAAKSLQRNLNRATKRLLLA